MLLSAPVDDLIEEQLYGALEDSMPDDGHLELRLPAGLPPEGQRLEDFSFDPRSGIFSARLITQGEESLGFRGQALVTVPALVPRERVPAGHILTAQDLREVLVAQTSIPAASLRKAEDLLGKETRRILLKDRPVPSGSVSEPRVVKRGDEVTISLKKGGLSLTATGKALQDGAVGETIRIINLGSHKPLTATIAGQGHVLVEN